MKKILLICFLIVAYKLAIAQSSWTYNFNNATATASFTTGASTTFLPNPSTNGGTARVRIGTTAGSFNLTNPGTTLGSSYELNGVAPTSTSVNKLSIYGYTGAKMFSTSFKVRFDGGASGTWYFFQGSGAMYSDNNSFSSSQVFSGLRFVFGSSNTIVTSRRDAVGWNSTVVNAISAQATDYLVEIIGNNSTSTTTYSKSGSQSVASNTWDLWIDGVLVGDDISKSTLVGDTNVDSFTFYGESSASNVATIYLDDFNYSIDFTSPTFTTLYPKAENISATSFDLTSNINEAGTTYYVVLADGATPPTSAQVAAGKDASNNVISSSGSFYNMSANSDFIKSITGLTTNTPYDIYVVAKDVSINLQSSPLKLDVTPTGTLPIKLTAFTGIAINQSILLNWNTASEINNDFYDVLRSADGRSFASIGKVKGSGTSTTLKDYAFSDENPFAGTNYYQLVQHDFDGKNASSTIISIDSKIDATKLRVYANVSSVKVSISSPNKTKGLLHVFDITGRKLSETSIEVNKGFNHFDLPLSLVNGVHFVRFTSANETINQKFIK